MASILIVDDSAACRNVTAALLRAEGHRVSCADNAWRGLTILESMPVDLVILDLQLPGLNGGPLGLLKRPCIIRYEVSWSVKASAH